MIGNISHTSQTAANVNKTGQGQAVNSPPRLSVHDHEGDRAKAQSIAVTASASESQNVQLAEPSSPPNPEATKQTIRALINAIYSDFNIPPPDNTDLAYKTIIEALQKRDQNVRAKHSMENNLSLAMSQQQADAQKADGAAGVSRAIQVVASGISIAVVGGTVEYGGSVSQYRGEVGKANQERLPELQAEFNALPQKQAQQRQPLVQEKEEALDAALLDRNPAAADQQMQRVNESEASLAAMDAEHATQRTTMQAQLNSLAASVAALPGEAIAGLNHAGRYITTGGMIINRNLASSIENLLKEMGASDKMEEQSKATMNGAAAGIYANMAQESSKEADGGVSMIAQMIEAMVKRHDMEYNTINFAAQKI